jgi:hypothetical protein
MFTPLLYTVAAGAGVVVGAIGVVAVSEVTRPRAGVGAFTGALAWRGSQHLRSVTPTPPRPLVGQPVSSPAWPGSWGARCSPVW